jgi:hypothetical protein
MTTTRRKAAFAVLLGALCVAVGAGVGNAGSLTFGPCITDATNTCATTCKDVFDSNNNFMFSVSSTDATQLPYCKGDPTQPKDCNPSAAFKNCNYSRYAAQMCQGTPNSWTNAAPICK